ncbi:ubiquitin-conjugating enzyme E2 C-like [Glossophaga mutica]
MASQNCDPAAGGIAVALGRAGKRRVVGKLQQLMTPMMPGDKGFPPSLVGLFKWVEPPLEQPAQYAKTGGSSPRSSPAAVQGTHGKVPHLLLPPQCGHQKWHVPGCPEGQSTLDDVRTSLLSRRSLREPNINSLLSTRTAELGKNLAALEVPARDPRKISSPAKSPDPAPQPVSRGFLLFP